MFLVRLIGVPRTVRPTLADVAAAAGVSRALVSIVVRGAPGASAQTRLRVLAIANELGYRPDQRARLLRQRESRLLGVVFGVQNAFHSDLVAATYRAAEATGYEVLLSGVAPGRTEQRAVETLLDERCGALILLGPTATPAWLSGLAARAPVVTIARRLRAAGVDTVRTADVRGTEAAVDHVVGLGHRAIAHLDGGRTPGAVDRRRGYVRAMKRHGLAASVDIVSAGVGEDDGARAACVLLARTQGNPTALVAFNDACAVGALDTFLRAGVSVPDEISVVGNDDSHLARLAHIDLTTIAQPVDALARAAVDLAISRLADPDDRADRDEELDPQLVVRSTTAAPRTR